LREGRVVATGATRQSLTAERLTVCFGLPISLTAANGRWSATAT
jgi:ABC-type hemin transport system ATPase subunit